MFGFAIADQAFSLFTVLEQQFVMTVLVPTYKHLSCHSPPFFETIEFALSARLLSTRELLVEKSCRLPALHVWKRISYLIYTRE